MTTATARQTHAIACVRRHVCPDVPRWFGVDGSLECGEQQAGVGGMLDVESASDWWLRTRHGIYPVATRVQWPRVRAFDTFTVRATSHGARTELHKLRDARDHGATMPVLHLQLYCGADDELLAGAVVLTRDLLALIDAGRCQWQVNSQDGNGFAVVTWLAFIVAGHKIIVVRRGDA